MGGCNYSSYDPLGNLCIMYTSCSHVTDEYCSACSSGHRDCPVHGEGEDGDDGSNNSTGSYGGENTCFCLRSDSKAVAEGLGRYI
jgi:hypothetical protein